MKIITILGARPQFIKAAAVSRELASESLVREVLLHTGQHFDQNMSEIFFDQMGLAKPPYNLEIHGLSHGAMTGRMLEEIEKILTIENPSGVVVYGDTNSTLAGALAARKLNIPVAHIEAGLRSFQMTMPEEVNRIVTDKISDLCFCPTQGAIDHLKREGQSSECLHLVGDVMYDACLHFKEHRVEPKERNFYLATVHRQENTNDPERLRNIVEALNVLHQSKPVVVPLHPRTKKMFLSQGLVPKFQTVDPVGYLEMLGYLHSCDGVLTDSGGLQKEAYFFNKRCLTLRDETEWVELVDQDVNRLVGAQKERILNNVNFLESSQPFPQNLYGDGRAAEKIKNVLVKEWGK